MAEDVNAYIAGLSEKYPGPNSDHCLVLIEVDDDVLDDIAKLVHNKILYHLFPVDTTKCINSFGLKRVFYDSILVCPKPRLPLEDELNSGASSELSVKFSSLVNLARQVGWIRVGTVSSHLEGTTAWLLMLENANSKGDKVTWTIRILFKCHLERASEDGAIAMCMNCSRYWKVLGFNDVLTSMTAVQEVSVLRSGSATGV
uniref:Glucosamine-phosphate N-acetyltransferase n=1 Tax=Syphacia muris TaxID=451379 RepID=A0A0N5AZY4_9BILA